MYILRLFSRFIYEDMITEKTDFQPTTAESRRRKQVITAKMKMKKKKITKIFCNNIRIRRIHSYVKCRRRAARYRELALTRKNSYRAETGRMVRGWGYGSENRRVLYVNNTRIHTRRRRREGHITQRNIHVYCNARDDGLVCTAKDIYTLHGALYYIVHVV